MKINSKNILTILIVLVMIFTLNSAVMAQNGGVTIEQTIPDEIYPNDDLGQEYVISITNDSGEEIDNLEVVLDIADGFIFDEDKINSITIEGNTVSDYTVSEDTNKYTISFEENDIDDIPLADGSSLEIDYKLSTADDLNDQEKDLEITFKYEDEDNERQEVTDTENLNDRILFGELDIDLSLNPQPMHRGGEFTVTATITNEGEGKLFNTTLTPNQSSGFSEPLFDDGDGDNYNEENWPEYLIPELEANDTYTFIKYTYTVVDKENFETLELKAENPATEVSDVTESANFRFNPRKPFIEIDPQTDPATIDFDTSEEIDIEITNTNVGDGPARDFKINTNIPASYDVIELSEGWSYADGVFTYDAENFPPGENDEGYSETLSFKLQTDDPLNQSAGTITLQAEYTDDEDNPFSRPFETFDYNVTGIPTLNIESTASTTADHGDTDRMYLGENISYEYTLSLTEIDRFADDEDIVVELTEFDDDRLTISEDTPDPDAGTFNKDNKTWTLSKDDFLDNGEVQNLSIKMDFEITEDINNAKSIVTTTANASGKLELTVDEEDLISINDTTSDSFYLQSRYEEVKLGEQTKEIDNLPDEGSFDYTRTDDKHRVEYIVSYSFEENSAGTWTGSIITDDMDNDQIYNDDDGFIQYSTDGGSTWEDVPTVNIISTEGDLQFELDFLADDDNFDDDDVAGETVHFRYKLEVTQAGDIDSWTTLNLNGVNGSTEFYQVVRVPVSGASANVSVEVQKDASRANDIDRGELVDLVINVTKNPWLIDNLIVEVDPGGYTYIDYSDINDLYIEVTGFKEHDPEISYEDGIFTFNFTGAGKFKDEDLGTIKLNNIAKDCSDNFKASADISYKHGLHRDAVEDDFKIDEPIEKTSNSSEPTIKRKSDLIIRAVNPVIVDEKQVTWEINVTNTDIGTARNVEFIGTFGEVFAYESSKIEGVEAELSNSNDEYTWDLDEIESGTTKTIEITADITDADSRDDFLEEAFDSTVKWYTAEVNGQKEECGENDKGFFPRFVEPSQDTDMTVRNNLELPSELNICDEGRLEIIIKNRGEVTNYNVEVIQDFLDTGISYDSDKDIEVDGTSINSNGDPEIINDESKLIFDEELISELNEMSPGEEVKISFGIKTGTNFNDNNIVQPTVNWNPPSYYDQDDQEKSRGGREYAIPRIRPEINLELKGRNESIDETEFVDNPAAFAGEDKVLWRFEIENVGDGEAKNVRLNSSDFGNDVELYNDEELSSNGITNENGYWEIENIAANDTKTYYLAYVVPSDSNDTVEFNANVTWGCEDDDNRLNSPGDPDDYNILTTVPAIDIDHSVEELTRKDGTVRITLENTGAPIYNLEINYNLDERYQLKKIAEYESELNNEDTSSANTWTDIEGTDDEPSTGTDDDSFVQGGSADDLTWNWDGPIPAGTHKITFELVDSGENKVDLDAAKLESKVTAEVYDINEESIISNEDILNITPEIVNLTATMTPEQQVISDINLDENVEWDITVENEGNAPAENVKIELDLGDGFKSTDSDINYSFENDNEPIEFDDNDFKIENGKLIWENLDFGDSDQIDINVTTKMNATGDHSAQLNAEEISPHTGATEDSIEEQSAYAAAFLLEKEITDEPESSYYTPGEKVEYTLTMNFIGEVEYESFTLEDILPDGLEYIDDSQNKPGDWTFEQDDKSLSWDINELDISDSENERSINYQAIIVKDGDVSKGSNVENTAKAEFNIEYGDGIKKAYDSDEFDSLKASEEFRFQEPKLTIVRSAENENTNIVAGTVINHTITVSNEDGDQYSPAYETKIIETIPEGFRDKAENIKETVAIEKIMKV